MVVPQSDELMYEGYNWTQTDEKVTFEFFIPSHLSEENVSVSIDTRTLWAGISSSPDIIKGKLYASVDKDMSSWTLSHHKSGKIVQINLFKDVKGSQWPVAITGGLRLREDADAKSTFLLGQLTEGVLPSKTMELYRKSAKAGHLPAQLKLGHIYDVGQSNMVDAPNKKEALHWYILAAAQGCLAAVFYSANFYYRGENKNHSKAVALYLEAISLSQKCPLPPPDIVKQFDVSGVPHFITPVSVTDRNRLMIFVTACYLAGKILYYGSEDGVVADPQKSRELWMRAADYFHAASLYSLGILYMEGQGVAVDLLEASRYFHYAFKIDPSYVIPEGIPQYVEPTEDSAYVSVSTTPTLTSQVSPPLPHSNFQSGPDYSEVEACETLSQASSTPTVPSEPESQLKLSNTDSVETFCEKTTQEDLEISNSSEALINADSGFSSPQIRPRGIPMGIPMDAQPDEPGSSNIFRWVSVGLPTLAVGILIGVMIVRHRN